jgi:hypothetical protein
LWITLALLLAGLTVFGLSNLGAQRPPLPGMGGFGFPEVGRYQAVRATDDSIILIDTTTGELYRATPRDIKPFSERPKPEARKDGLPPLPKDTLKDLPAPPKDFPLKDLPPLPKDVPAFKDLPPLKDAPPPLKDATKDKEKDKDKPSAKDKEEKK